MDNLEKIAIYEKGIASQFVDEEYKEQMRAKIAELKGIKNSAKEVESTPTTPQVSEREYFSSFLNDINISIKYADNDEEKAYFEALKSDIEISLKYSE
jgi:hypothetical protein